MADMVEDVASSHISGDNESISPNFSVENTIVEEPKFGLMQLIATLMDLKTLPHILLLLILSTVLYALAQGPDSANLYAAIGFISLSFGYSLTAMSTRWDFAARMVRVEGLAADSWFKSLLLRSLRAWTLPLLLSGLICFGLLQLVNGNSNWATWIPLSLASLFLLWSIGQGISFKSGTSAWLSSGKKVLQNTQREGTVIGTSAWQISAVSAVAILIGYGFSSGFQGETSEQLKWIGFIILAITIQVGMIYWMKDTIIDVSTTKGGARFATRWGVISQVFVTWHLASAWRRLIDEPQAFTMIIEEFILMILTVLLAIWSLASRDVNRGGKIFTSQNALFWGLAFGFGYAGSIAMITNLSNSVGGGNLATTMAIGHLVTAITLIMIHPKTLRNHKNRVQNPPQAMQEERDDIEIPATELQTVDGANREANAGEVSDLKAPDEDAITEANAVEVSDLKAPDEDAITEANAVEVSDLKAPDEDAIPEANPVGASDLEALDDVLEVKEPHSQEEVIDLDDLEIPDDVVDLMD